MKVEQEDEESRAGMLTLLRKHVVVLKVCLQPGGPPHSFIQKWTGRQSLGTGTEAKAKSWGLGMVSQIAEPTRCPVDSP